MIMRASIKKSLISRVMIILSFRMIFYVIVNVRVGWYFVVDNVLATEAVRPRSQNIINDEIPFNELH